jgi:acetoin utilization deacetylase AcuC-like enzyme
LSLILVHSDRFTEHETPPGHPESTKRGDVMSVTAREWSKRGGEVVAPRAVSHEQLARVHDEAYLKRIAETAGRAVSLDPDTFTSPESYDVARLAAGAAV